MITIITNNVPRDVIDAWELSEEEQEEFDYLDWGKIKAGEDSRSFARYKGELYDLDDFLTTWRIDVFKEWNGYISDTFFSGILVKFSEDFEQVVMGRYYS